MGPSGYFQVRHPLAMVMPQGGQERDTQEGNAYLLAAAPQLFEVCQKFQALLENSFIVTPEGIRLNDSDLRQSLLEALLRAGGYRRDEDGSTYEPTRLPEIADHTPDQLRLGGNKNPPRNRYQTNRHEDPS
jgi:hypothetical protein